MSRAHGLVTGFRSEDTRRYFKIPIADVRGGKCVDCRAEVFVNIFGASALRDRDADCICANCDAREGALVDKELIES